MMTSDTGVASVDIQSMARQIANHQGRLYLVGGSVRDKMMGRAAKDDDYCVVGLSQPTFANLFPNALLAGRDFPVFRMLVDDRMTEFALARTEQKVTSGHKGFVSQTGEHISIEEDLIRRDFTVNAMAVDVLSGDWIDPFHGQSDVETKTLRAVSAAFAEDPLRAYRGARFACELGFTVEGATLQQMESLGEELSTLSVERVFEELKRALLTDRPSVFFRTLHSANLLSAHFAELQDLTGVVQPVKYHPEGDAFEHTLQVLDAAASLTPRPEVRFSALTHDFGKALTPKHLWPSHKGHERLGISPTTSLCARLKVPVQWRQAALFATEFHMKIRRVGGLPAEQVVDLLAAAARNPLGVEGFSIIGLADAKGRNNPDAVCPNATLLPELWAFVTEAVSGNDLNTTATGKAFGEELRLARANAVSEWRRNHID